MELPNARSLFPKVCQHGAHWCIPAGFQVLLRYFGITKPTQEHMVLRYDELYGANGHKIGNQNVVFPTKPTIYQLTHCGFLVGNFDIFTQIANELLPAGCPYSFHHPANSAANFENFLTKTLKKGQPMLTGIRLQNGDCHVLPIIGYKEQTVTVYDPASGAIQTKAAGEFTFTRDCVILKKERLHPSVSFRTANDHAFVAVSASAGELR